MEIKEVTDIPTTLDEALTYLDLFLQDKDLFKECPEDDVLGIAHTGLGRFIRNKWYLWWSPELYERVKSQTEETQYPATRPELVKYFNDLGIEHADDMSAIVIMAYHKKLNNKVYDMDEDIRAIKAYYEQQANEGKIIISDAMEDNDDEITQSMKNEQE
jgi:hypothetical protein